jgi:hypothetical protein
MCDWEQLALPSSEALAPALAEMLGASTVTLVDRRAPFHPNTEVVLCRLESGRTCRLVCKYGARRPEPAHGLRGGVPYEAEIYRTVLVPLGARVPPFYGARKDEETGLTWLVLGYVAGHRKLWSEDEVLRAAQWIGSFHAQPEGLMMATRAHSYDTATYAGFAARASELAGPLNVRYPWFRGVCEQFGELAAELDAGPKAFIHGEYVGQNILCSRGRIVPVDWESSAVGAGELDLASLIDRWPARLGRAAAGAYREARWPEGAPLGFDRRLELARLFMHLRWLGDRPEWTMEDGIRWRFPALRGIAAGLGLLPASPPRRQAASA